MEECMSDRQHRTDCILLLLRAVADRCQDCRCPGGHEEAQQESGVAVGFADAAAAASDTSTSFSQGGVQGFHVVPFRLMQDVFCHAVRIVQDWYQDPWM